MKRIIAFLLCLLLLTGCVPAGQDDTNVNIVATTYPTYLAVLAVTEGVEGVSVSRLDTGSVSCLHDYTLTVNDMKKLSRADIIVMSGAGMEDFMTDALATSRATVIDCSAGVELLSASGHHDHDHDHDHSGHYDTHYWMDPANMSILLSNILDQLSTRLGPQDSTRMATNTEHALSLLKTCELECRSAVRQVGSDVALITFHDGFAYFAAAFDLPLLASIEEEAGSEASAKEIIHISALVKQHGLPVIFTEVNGSQASAQVISRETGCAVASLSMIMDGPDPVQSQSPITLYTQAITHNVSTICGAFS